MDEPRELSCADDDEVKTPCEVCEGQRTVCLTCAQIAKNCKCGQNNFNQVQCAACSGRGWV